MTPDPSRYLLGRGVIYEADLTGGPVNERQAIEALSAPDTAEEDRAMRSITRDLIAEDLQRSASVLLAARLGSRHTWPESPVVMGVVARESVDLADEIRMASEITANRVMAMRAARVDQERDDEQTPDQDKAGRQRAEDALARIRDLAMHGRGGGPEALLALIIEHASFAVYGACADTTREEFLATGIPCGDRWQNAQGSEADAAARWHGGVSS